MKKIYDETHDLWVIEFTEDEIEVIKQFGDSSILKYDKQSVDNDEVAEINRKLEEAWLKYENLFSENLKTI